MLTYILRAKHDSGYDCMKGCVVNAKNAKAAREIAARNHGDEGAMVWMNANLSTCIQVGVYKREGLLIRDYCHG